MIKWKLNIFKQKTSIVILAFSLILLSISIYFITRKEYRSERIPPISAVVDQEIEKLYHACNLSDRLRYDIFRRAVIGYKHIQLKNLDVITIIDFTKPSTDKRCFVINIPKEQLLYNTYVAHGKYTGENYARFFSNRKNSKQSSLGFYKTGKTYKGKHGYSLRLEGLEKNINHHAKARDIVIHSADYVSEEFIQQHGRLGRSWGCPAFPVKLSTNIINSIKNGSCLYIYADDDEYLNRSFYIEAEINNEEKIK